jgi:hypothetical protein
MVGAPEAAGVLVFFIVVVVIVFLCGVRRGSFTRRTSRRCVA